MAILVYAEHDNKSLKPATRAVVTAAQKNWRRHSCACGW